MDQDLWLRSLFFHGPLLLNSIVNDIPSNSQNVPKKQKIYNFIKNNHQFLFDERPKVSNKHFTFSPLPVELFWDCSFEQRRKLFFKNLERGEILILKVINDSLQDNYKLQVLAKHQCCMKLDDLSLVMYLPKLLQELELAGGGLTKYDVIKAAVCSCSINERKLFVTLDSTILDDDAETVRLGKISVDELPDYVGDIQITHSCYKSYFHQSSAYIDPNWANRLYETFEFKKNHLYSFYKDWDGKECRATESGEYLKKKHALMLSNTHYGQAVEYYQAQNFSSAIASLNHALAIYPLNKRALVSRGTLYANTNNLRKAFCDTEQALKIDPLYEPAQKQMSVLLVAAAKTHIQSGDFAAAKESLLTSVGLDEQNEEAVRELAKLEILKKEKVPEISVVPSSSSESVAKSKKKKKKHRRSHETPEKRKIHRHKSKSFSPKIKKRKSMQSVVSKT